jgi:hypothetical protein
MCIFLSPNFYRIERKDGRLVGISINYKDQDSLKDSLNLKLPGKISVVLNNNKTPHHWLTLKETEISQALHAIDPVLTAGDYILESVSSNSTDEFSRKIYGETVDSIFKGGKSVIVLGWKTNDSDDLIGLSTTYYDDDEDEEIDHTINFDCLCVEPSLILEFEKLGLSLRFKVSIDIKSYVKYTLVKVDDELVKEVYDLDNEATNIEIDTSPVSDQSSGFDVSPYLKIITSEISNSDLNFNKKGHYKFFNTIF